MPNERENKIKIILFDIFDMLAFLVFMLGIIFVIRIFIINPFNIVGTSMYPTFDDGDFVLISKLSTKMGNVKRGDVIVFVPPHETLPYIKRVVGLPGETIKINSNHVYVCNSELQDIANCDMLEEKYLKPDTITEANKKDVFVVKDGYFVMGDNRTNSTDSRSCFGSSCLKDSNFIVPYDNILGKVIIELIPNINTDFSVYKQ